MSILITGGTKGIGLAIAEAFARNTSDVFLNYHGDDAAAQDAAAQVAAVGGRPHLIKADVGTPEGCAAIVAAVRRTTDRLSQVVHCAVDAYSTTALRADPARFTRAVITNGASLLFLVGIPGVKAGGKSVAMAFANSALTRSAAIGVLSFDFAVILRPCVPAW